MDDYSYLEDVGRKVGEWGSEISRGGYGNGNGGDPATASRGTGRGRGRGRGRGGRAGPSGSQSKKDLLKMHLDLEDISIEYLPEGMRKRKLNQSNWNAK